MFYVPYHDILVLLILSYSGLKIRVRTGKLFSYFPTRRQILSVKLDQAVEGSLTLAMGKSLRFSVKIKVCKSSLSSP